jgi:membrane protease YdiL (CAAX protease family)
MSTAETPFPDFPEFPPPPDPPRPVATWNLLEAVPVFVITVILTTLVGLVASFALQSRDATVIAASAAFELALAASVLGWIRLMHRDALPALGLPVRPWRELGRGVVGGLLVRLVAAFGIGPIVVVLIQAFTDRAPSVPDQVPTDLHTLPTVLFGIVVVVGAPIGEELFFRGFLFNSLRRHGFWLAAVLSSLAFGLVHVVNGNWFLVPIMFFVGLGFAWLYERDGRILTPIAAHATFNLIGILFLTLTS